METIKYINYIIAIAFVACYSYQFFYLFLALVKKPREYQAAPPKRYAVMISARNEEEVISHLIDSINCQNYPADMVDVYVVADNCTDRTAAVAGAAGAVVYERFDTARVGKGYAMEFLFQRVLEKHPGYYDGFFIFDADNLLDPDYIAEMNKTFSAGYGIVTSYRNSKNYGTNWISAGYALWFLREAKYLNNPRSILGTSCAVSGTGFMISREVIERNGGWKFFLLTEDIEFTVDSILHGDKIGYCHKAVLYDEQPETFRQSWRQRMRWAKGYLQVFRNYGCGLIGGIFSRKVTSCYDMMMTIMPAIILTMVSFVLNGTAAIIALVMESPELAELLKSVGQTLLNMYLLLFALGVITGITEWKNIHCGTARKIGSFFTFPLFMFTYIPISATAMFRKVEWKPIKHSRAMTIRDMKKV